MHSFDEQDYDQPLQEVTNQATEMAKSKTKNMARKTARKAFSFSGKALKKMGTLLAKTFANAMASLIASLSPFLIAIILILIVAVAGYFVIYEIRGSSQSYSLNNYSTTNSSGKYHPSLESIQTNRFYSYISGQSYNIKIGNGHEIYSPDAIEMRDYYEREKMYTLNKDFLYVLNSFVYKESLVYPEPFLKPVNYDPETMKPIPLTDEDGNLTALSQQVNLSTGEKLEEKELSVRDYGLGAVITFVDQDKRSKEDRFYEERRLAFNYVAVEIWDEENKIVKRIPYSTYNPEAKPVNAQGHHYDEPAAENNKKAIDLIESVVHMGGFVQYEYDANPTTGNPNRQLVKPFSPGRTDSASNEDYEWVKYSTYKTEEPFPLKDEEGNTMYDEEGNVLTELREVEKPLYMQRTGGVSIVTPKAKIVDYASEKNRYLYDYLQYFETLIPEDVLLAKNFEERINKDSYIFKDFDNIDFGNESFTMGSKKDSPNVLLAQESGLEYFMKYGKRYGVDPKLLIAMAAQESSGDHNRYLSEDRCKVAGCGIMQIEKPGITIPSLRAYNYDTESYETMIISYEVVKDLEQNIKAGAMQLANRIEEWEGNILLALQAYNFGSKGKGGGMGQLLALAQKETSLTPEHFISNVADTSWMAYRAAIHLNPYENGVNGTSPSSTYGDPLYVEHVLAYYGGESLGENITLPPKSFTDNVLAGVGQFFSGLFNHPSKNKDNKQGPVSLFTQRNTRHEVDLMLRMAQSMSRKVNLSQTSTEALEISINDEGFWEGILTENISKEDFFAKFPFAVNYAPVLKVENPRITSPYGWRNGRLHKGTDIGLPIGTNLYAVTSGTVYLARCASTPGLGCPTNDTTIKNDQSGGRMVWINHDDGTQSRYMHMDSYAVKEGDRVVAGQLIGTSGNTGNGQAHLHFEYHNAHGNSDASVDSTLFFTDTFIRQPNK